MQTDTEHGEGRQHRGSGGVREYGRAGFFFFLRSTPRAEEESSESIAGGGGSANPAEREGWPASMETSAAKP